MIDAHRGAFEFDWRTRLHAPLSVIGRSMSWGEALRHTERLASDPSAAITASISEWAHPVDHDVIVLMNLFDLTHEIAWRRGGSKGARPKKYPRPWPDIKTRVMKPTVSQEAVLAALRLAGHTGLPPLRKER